MSSYGEFPFRLTAERDAHARRLHAGSVVVDMTFQGPASPDVWTDELLAALKRTAGDPPDFAAASEFLLEEALAGRLDGYRELFDRTGATTGLTGCVLEDADQLLDAAAVRERTLEALAWLRPVRGADDVRAAHDAGEHALLGMCQVNRLTPDTLHLLDRAHALGLAHTVECAYNTLTAIGGGCTEPHDPGLSSFGRAFVRRCNDIGAVVDTAHSGPRTTLDACRASRGPVVATHTGAAALYACDRAKSDEEIRAIADTGGVVGVVTVPFYLAPPGTAGASIELTLDHIDHMVALVGAEHVGIGTDWPLAVPGEVMETSFLPLALSALGFRPEHRLDVTATLDGFRDYRDLVNITRGLVARGYTDSAVRSILGGNVLRVLADVAG